jgi:hypothetical protein
MNAVRNTRMNVTARTIARMPWNAGMDSRMCMARFPKMAIMIRL